MTAREFCWNYAVTYDIPMEAVLHLLDIYLAEVAPVQYVDYPNSELPEEFVTALDEPANFDEFFKAFLEEVCDE
jgi:hypothetical protein